MRKRAVQQLSGYRERRCCCSPSRCSCSGRALSQAQIARWLLAPSLAARVEQLTETRAGAVDAAAAELQRIERDLHDGAQARLVALAMDLGMAEERFDRDPESARELVGEAREEAKRALAELRDLARGMRPSLLAERGLGRGDRRARRAQPGAGDGDVDVAERAAGGGRDGGLVRGLRGARQHRQAQRRRARGRLADAAQRRAARRGRRRRRAAAPTRPAPACAGSRSGSRRSTARSRSTARPAGRRWCRAVLPCG